MLRVGLGVLSLRDAPRSQGCSVPGQNSGAPGAQACAARQLAMVWKLRSYISVPSPPGNERASTLVMLEGGSIFITSFLPPGPSRLGVGSSSSGEQMHS